MGATMVLHFSPSDILPLYWKCLLQRQVCQVLRAVQFLLRYLRVCTHVCASVIVCAWVADSDNSSSQGRNKAGVIMGPVTCSTHVRPVESCFCWPARATTAVMQCLKFSKGFPVCEALQHPGMEAAAAAMQSLPPGGTTCSAAGCLVLVFITAQHWTDQWSC